MPEQTQIFSGSIEDAPKDYVVGANVEFVLRCVNALYTDNGAGADWLPAVVLISDSGHVIGRALLPDVKVTAGDDAEVTFFPGVKPGAGSATSTVTPIGWIRYTPPVGLIPAGPTYLPLLSVLNTVPGTFVAGGTGNNPFTINSSGVFLFSLWATVTNPHATPTSISYTIDGINAPGLLTSTNVLLDYVIPANTTLASPINSSAVAGQVDVGENEANLKIVASDTLNVVSVSLVVSQLSTAFLA